MCRTHQGHQATVLVKVGAVHNKVFEHPEVLKFRRSLLEPVVLDSLELCRTVTGEIRDLPDRVILHDPELEPVPFIVSFVSFVLSDKGLGAQDASKPLFMVGAAAEALNVPRTAKRAEFF